MGIPAGMRGQDWDPLSFGWGREGVGPPNSLEWDPQDLQMDDGTLAGFAWESGLRTGFCGNYEAGRSWEGFHGICAGRKEKSQSFSAGKISQLRMRKELLGFSAP